MALVLRIQSSCGTKRVEVYQNTTITELYELVRLPFKNEIGQFTLFRERNFTNEIHSSDGITIDTLDLVNGDCIYLKELSSISGRTKIDSVNISKSPIIEDEVDQQLSKLSGSIPRNRDPKLCRHSSNGCCVHCSPLEPWDEKYRNEHKIKHMSFHAYLRKLTSNATSGKSANLENIQCSIKNGCTDHLPWPKGICSKCQPSAITLNPQTYRHVDNIVFENTSLVERFLDFWRSTGNQRIGYLYGTYEVYNDVPLGVRANVAAIYEPPQEGSRDAVKLLEDENSSDVEFVAKSLGLMKVGWIFTDLLCDDAETGSVKHMRGSETYFLSAEECILAAQLQNQHPNISKHSSSGKFGSKFVTVCVTGDKKNQVHMEGYAVSSQCMALVRDNCLIPTKDAPELGYIREPTNNQFVPDVFYKLKDQYGNEVSRLARPLPVEYLLVDIPASTPLVPTFTFVSMESRKPFPIENRISNNNIQEFNALSDYLKQWQPDELLLSFTDFHFLIYLTRLDMVPMKPIMGELLQCVSRKDVEQLKKWKLHEAWTTLESLVFVSSNMLGDQNLSATSSVPNKWTCDHCTFINGSALDICEMCGLPH